MEIKIKKLHEDAIIPKYQTKGSSGFDLHALEDITLNLFDTTLIRTGLAFSFPEGLELQIRPRSGLSLKTGLRITNSPGTCDQDYSKEVCVIMQLLPDAHGTIAYNLKKGDRIAQGVICPIVQVEFNVVEELDQKAHERGGFGSTGV